MNKLVTTTLAGLFLLFSVTQSYADIWVTQRNANYVPSGAYQAKITEVSIGTSETKDANDKVISNKHNYVYVTTTNQNYDDLTFAFSGDDLSNGLSLMSAVGKNITVDVGQGADNRLTVGRISIK